MGCVQRKSSQNSDNISVNQHLGSKKHIYLSFHPASTPGKLDFQTAFKVKLIQDLIRNEESKEKQTRRIDKKYKGIQSPAQREKNPNQMKPQKGVSESADGYPLNMIPRKRSQSLRNC